MQAFNPGGDMSENTIRIDELIDSNPVSRLQWRVVSLCFILAMIDGFDAQSIAYVAPLLSQQFSLSPEVMGQLMSAAMVGLMFGALIGSPISDRIGRKPIIVFSVGFMGIFSLLTANADSTTELFLFRFLTGMGLGGVMPNINILTAEFAPASRRALLMTIMFVGFPIGIIVGGLAAAALINLFGWESVFVAGGILPLTTLPFILFMLPESPRLLALKGNRGAALSAIINQIAPTAGTAANSRFEIMTPDKKKGSVRALFIEGRAPVTLLLWVVFCANILTLTAIVSWLPSVLEAAGFPLDRAILATVLFSIGGVIGGLVIAVTIDRVGAIETMRVALLIATVAVAMIGQVTGSLVLLLATLFLAGATAMGTQFGLNAMTSNIYDTNCRATGLGWALAVGRLGAITAPILVGIAVGLDLHISRLFMLGAIPMLVAAVSVFLLGFLNTSRAR